MYRTELGPSSEQFLTSCQSVATFFDAVAGIRLRQMPHHSSRWDKVLKWAEFFAAQVQGYSDEVFQFADCADQAAHIVWASSLCIIKVTEPAILLKTPLIMLHSWGQNISRSWKRRLVLSTAVVLRSVFFLRHHELLHSSEELQLIMSRSFIDLLKLVTGINIDCTHKQLC